MATVNTGDTITAANYNDLQSRVATIMGTGSADSGYGQTLASAQVSTGNTVTATHMDNLRTDINKANLHQTGSSASIGNIAVGQIIGANASGTAVGSLTQTDEGYNDYDTAVTLITTNKKLLDNGQGTLEDVITSQRTTNWQTEIQHVFTCDFTTADNARFFFNTGSTINVSLSLTGGSGSKTTSWANLFSSMGSVVFTDDNTLLAGPATIVNIGWYDLTTSYQQIATTAVGGGGVYDENNVVVNAKRNTAASTLTIQVRLIDADAGDQRPGFLPGPGVDEPVTGTTTSTVQRFRATGVNVEAPTFSTTSSTDLSAGS